MLLVLVKLEVFCPVLLIIDSDGNYGGSVLEDTVNLSGFSHRDLSTFDPSLGLKAFVYYYSNISFQV